MFIPCDILNLIYHDHHLSFPITMSAPTANGKQTTALPPSKPIDILQSQAAQLYANLHPILLISVLLFSFKTLVEDPVSTLLGLAPTVTILQAIYCVLSLPSSGQTTTATPKPGQKKKSAKPTQDAWAKVVVRLPCAAKRI